MFCLKSENLVLQHWGDSVGVLLFIDLNFIFGDYKTVKKYGIQRINITKELNTVINMWLSARTASSSEYLLVNKNVPGRWLIFRNMFPRRR